MRLSSSLLILPLVVLLAGGAARDLSSRAKGNLAAIISAADYPPAALRAGEQGVVEFQLDIAANGNVSACRILSSSGSQILDDATCRIMVARARFVPAHDRKGRPVADRIHNRVRWALPQERPAPPQSEPIGGMPVEVPADTPPSSDDSNGETPADGPPPS